MARVICLARWYLYLGAYSQILPLSITKIQNRFCAKCQYRMKRKSRLNRRVKTAHRKIRELICTECDHTSGEYGELIAHVRNVDGMSIVRFRHGQN